MKRHLLAARTNVEETERLASRHGIVGLSAGRGAVVILDSTDLREIARLPGGVFPDGLAYAPKVEKVFVSDEFGGPYS